MRIISFLIIAMVFSTLYSSAQKQNKDSLLNLIKTAKQDTIRIKAFSSLGFVKI
ncbi:MAG: hypothetical protein HY958_07680 [Bacteroidia bacterium]|nr:hypothetical protein [Bacteroidia bacterium]